MAKRKETVPDYEKSPWMRFLFSWEFILLLILVGIQIMNSMISPNYLNAGSISTAMMNFLDKSFMIFPMTMILLLGEIDISIGSTVALSAVGMGLVYQQTGSMVIAIVACLILASVCGLLNGILVNLFPELPTMIITLATLTIYRGFAYILLENQSISGFPDWFQQLGWGKLGEIPLIALAFGFTAIVFCLIMTKTAFGRELYAMGSNKKTSLFSGIKTKKNLLIVYTLMGAMAGITALFLSSRMSSVRADIASGYELEVISMCVLGGISTSGGKGKVFGPILGTFIIGFLRYGLGIINLRAQTITMILGVLLIISVLITRFDLSKISTKWMKRGTINETK